MKAFPVGCPPIPTDDILIHDTIPCRCIADFPNCDAEVKKLAAEVIAATNELSSQNRLQGAISTESIYNLEDDRKRLVDTISQQRFSALQKQQRESRLYNRTSNNIMETSGIFENKSLMDQSFYDADKQYEDITDVRVIAKIQEESTY